MAMIKPFTINNKPAEEKSPDNIVLDFTKPMGNVEIFVSEDEVKPERRRRSNSKVVELDNPLFTPATHMNTTFVETAGNENKSDRELSIMETNEPYENKFKETNAILRTAIMQLDMSMQELQNDIEDIRRSKTMRNKYTYLSNLQQSMGNMISNKIAAARELNSTISKCQDLEMKRYKEVKSVADANQNDDMKVMEMYKAFINTPLNNTPFPNVSQSAIAGLANPNSPMIGSLDDAYNNYIQNLTPAQNMMFLESNPNIKQVVVYDHSTGARYFDVMDMSTGQSVPNAEKHDSMFLEDVDIDFKNHVAKNINIGETYPLVEIGKPISNDY